MADISKTQRNALAELARGPLKYSVAGRTRDADVGTYFSSQTIEALVRRGLARFVDRKYAWKARVDATPKGRALARELGL